MNKIDKKTVKLYLSQITDALKGCSWSLKKVFANELRSQIKESFAEKEITYDSLCAAFGTPDEIAAGFFDREEYDKLLKRSRRLNLILSILIVVLVAVILFLLGLVENLWSLVGGKIVVEKPGIIT
jgi:predicted RND superfamily exporter protein